MVEHQGPRRRALCKIVVDGTDVTSRLDPYLISVQVIDKWGGDVDECNIELDDRNAELAIPPDDVKVDVYLGWAGEGPRLPDLGRVSEGIPTGGGGAFTPNVAAQFGLAAGAGQAPFGGSSMDLVFSGKVTSVESGFGRRGGGRRLWITATSGEVKGMAKSGQQQHFGEGQEDDSQEGGGGGGGQIPLTQVMSEIFGKAGLTAKLSPAMSMIKRSYWYVNESPMNFGQRMARELGGRFKISNGIAMLVGTTEGVNADGDKMPTVEAVWGVNLIGWRIFPFSGRPQWGSASARYFKLHEGEWASVKAAIGGETPFGASEAIAKQIGSVVDKGVGQQVNTGKSEDSKSKRGTGWVLLNGEPRCMCGGFISITGARPGVDGTYEIEDCEHNYTRGVGYTTRCNLMNPTPSGGYEKWREKPETEEQKAEREANEAKERAAEAKRQEMEQLGKDIDQMLADTPEARAEKEAAQQRQEELGREIGDLLGRLR